MEKKKVLIIMPSMFIGGAERSLLGLLDTFDYDKYDVSLFLYRHEGEFLPYIAEQVKILPVLDEYSTFDVPIKTLLFSRRFRFGLARLLSKMAAKLHSVVRGEEHGVWMSMQYISRCLQPLLPPIPGSYDIGISFLGIPDVLVNKVDAKVKLTWNHTDYTVLGPDKAYDRKIYSQVNYIVSVSKPCTEQFLKVYPALKDKAVTVENLISVSLLREQSKKPVSDMQKRGGETILLSIGRYSDAKNFDNVPFICKNIRQQGLNVKWYLIGYGGDEPLIRQKIAEAGMEEYVILLGKKSNPYPYIKACDIYVQPSRYEGKCVSVIEAQILNKPVIITNYATSASQLIDGYDGIIVPMDNEGCAEGIGAVIQDKHLQQKLIEKTKISDYTNAGEIQKLYCLMENQYASNQYHSSGI